jgi:hypothetical protein
MPHYVSEKINNINANDFEDLQISATLWSGLNSLRRIPIFRQEDSVSYEEK